VCKTVLEGISSSEFAGIPYQDYMKKQSCENIAGYRITTQDEDTCVEQIVSWISSGEKRKYFVCANPHSLELARSDRLLREAISRADLVTPDGIGIIIASKIHGGCILDRVTGSDIFLGLSHALNQEEGYRYFFLGSTEETLALIRHKMGIEFPNIEVAGTFSPPFKPEFTSEENGGMVEAVNNARPHVLWVGMTAPKQEKWIYQHRSQLEVPFIGAVGAVFDFFAGTRQRSGQWFQDHGFEWLPRLLREPKHVWDRNFITFPTFILRNVVIRLLSHA
jgi:N-acetylglucosaminyldiphosphoundecaprenol N-acetyl-beta-D-mannosaminyltransferase